MRPTTKVALEFFRLFVPILLTAGTGWVLALMFVPSCKFGGLVLFAPPIPLALVLTEIIIIQRRKNERLSRWLARIPWSILLFVWACSNLCWFVFGSDDRLGFLVAIVFASTIYPILLWIYVPARALWLATSFAKLGFRSLALPYLAIPIFGILTVIYGMRVSEFIQFRFRKAEYDQVVQRCIGTDSIKVEAISCQSPKMMLFPLGGFDIMSYGIVYDESDEISLPIDSRSEKWSRQEAGKVLKCESFDLI